VAGAHTLLLYLMARTPGAPAVKEIKPTAAISWKRIGYGEVHRRGRRCRVDADAVPLESAFGGRSPRIAKGTPLDGVFLDAGENGLFSMGEFETLTALGLMEYITPEEIATRRGAGDPRPADRARRGGRARCSDVGPDVPRRRAARGRARPHGALERSTASTPSHTRCSDRRVCRSCSSRRDPAAAVPRT
jgi:hypothetical protein